MIARTHARARDQTERLDVRTHPPRHSPGGRCPVAPSAALVRWSRLRPCTRRCGSSPCAALHGTAHALVARAPTSVPGATRVTRPCTRPLTSEATCVPGQQTRNARDATRGVHERRGLATCDAPPACAKRALAPRRLAADRRGSREVCRKGAPQSHGGHLAPCYGEMATRLMRHTTEAPKPLACAAHAQPARDRQPPRGGLTRCRPPLRRRPSSYSSSSPSSYLRSFAPAAQQAQRPAQSARSSPSARAPR